MEKEVMDLVFGITRLSCYTALVFTSFWQLLKH